MWSENPAPSTTPNNVGTRRRACSVLAWSIHTPLCPEPEPLSILRFGKNEITTFAPAAGASEQPRLRAIMLLHPPGKTRGLAIGPPRRRQTPTGRPCLGSAHSCASVPGAGAAQKPRPRQIKSLFFPFGKRLHQSVCSVKRVFNRKIWLEYTNIDGIFCAI